MQTQTQFIFYVLATYTSTSTPLIPYLAAESGAILHTTQYIRAYESLPLPLSSHIIYNFNRNNLLVISNHLVVLVSRVRPPSDGIHIV